MRKPTPAQMRILEALAGGAELRSYPNMGWFDGGGFRWSKMPSARNPNSRSVEALVGLGLLSVPPRKWGDFGSVLVTLTAKGRAMLEDA